MEYPVQLAIAYILLGGYLVRTLFVSLRLPASVGVIFAGFAFSYFMQDNILEGRDSIQELAFFFVLFTAGLEISLKDLQVHVLVFAVLPAFMEVIAVACYAALFMRWTFVEGMILGTVLVALGDGLVIPKMKEFGCTFKGHPIPRLVFTWAPLEASFVLTLFGTLVGSASPAHQHPQTVAVVVLASVVRIVATIACGAILGASSGWIISQRAKVTVFGRRVFTSSAVEAYLMVMAVCLFAYGLGANTKPHGYDVVPMGFSPGSAFQPELLVIVTGTSFSACVSRDVLQGVEAIMGGVWVFGQLILFSMLGSRTTTSIFPCIVDVLPVMIVGISARAVGVLIATLATSASRAPSQPWALRLSDAAFCFLSTLPRATIQGALGAVPTTQRFFEGQDKQNTAQDFIFVAARLYIFCMSIVGMMLLNTLGPTLLEWSGRWYLIVDDDMQQPEGAINDSFLSGDSNFSNLDAAGVMLADQYGLTLDEVHRVLVEAAEKDKIAEASDETGRSMAKHFTEPVNYQNSNDGTSDTLARCRSQPTRRKIGSGVVQNPDLLMWQLEAVGDPVYDTVSWRDSHKARPRAHSLQSPGRRRLTDPH